MKIKKDAKFREIIYTNGNKNSLFTISVSEFDVRKVIL
jgi:hypothetical protein